jgi:D-threo-aldose 1-dehydrogenase
MGDVLRALPREGFVLSTKVGRLLKPYGRVPPPRPSVKEGGIFTGELPFLPTFDFSYDATMRSFEDSLQRLGMNRVDVLLIHDCDAWSQGDRYPEALRTVERGALKALQELKAAGVISAFGAGVNQAEACEDLLDRGPFDCFMLAGRYTLLEQGALDRFLPRCVREGVSVILAAPYNSGILVSGAVPGARYNYVPAPPEVLDRVARIEAVARAHGVALAAAALQLVLAHPVVASVIPGGRSRAEAEQNARWAAAPIPDGFWAELKAAGLLRADAPVPWGTALRYHGAPTVIAALWGGVLLALDPTFFWWLAPVLASLMLALPLAVWSSRPRLGGTLAYAGLLATPGEGAPAQELVACMRHGAARAPADDLAAVVADPRRCALQVALVGLAHGARRASAGVALRRALIERAVADGPAALDRHERTLILRDAHVLASLHDAVWSATPDQALRWGIRSAS